MNLTLCSKSCPYQIDGRCQKPVECHSVSSMHDCPSCPYLTVCRPVCENKRAKTKGFAKRQSGYTCFFEDGMV